MPNKTLEQYQAEIEQLRKAINMPGVPDGEKQIYADTIQRIEGKIIDLHRAQPPGTPPSAPQSSAPLRHPSPLGEGTGGANRAARPRTAPPPTSATETPVIAAILTGSQKQVLIEWGHGKSDLLTEGEARSRFTTTLRDLSESRMAKLGRYDDLTRYITFSRAVAYYRALIEFWLSPPTPRQLAMSSFSRTRETIFDMIFKAACAAQTQL